MECHALVLAALNLDAPPDLVIDEKKQGLIDAGIKLFGERGFDGVSVREICKEANTNVAAVSYHFNGKRELFETCALYIMGHVRAHLKDVLHEIRAFLSKDEKDPNEALDLLVRFVGRMTEFLVPDASAAAEWSPFVTRFRMDMNTPASPALQDIGSVVLSTLVGIACRTEGEDLRNGALAQSLIGQVQVFRVNRGAALSSMGLETVSPEALEQIKVILQSSVRAIVLSNRQNA